MLHKRLTALLIAAVIMILPVVSMAAAETLPADYSGTVNYLIDIKNPDEVISSTVGKTCVLSAVAVPGTQVTLYSLNSANNTYEKIYADGKALEAVVGASGLYAQGIELKKGLNNIMVVAYANDEAIETVKLEITLLKSGIAESIKSLWQSLLNY